MDVEAISPRRLENSELIGITERNPLNTEYKHNLVELVYPADKQTGPLRFFGLGSYDFLMENSTKVPEKDGLNPLHFIQFGKADDWSFVYFEYNFRKPSWLLPSKKGIEQYNVPGEWTYIGQGSLVGVICKIFMRKVGKVFFFRAEED